MLLVNLISLAVFAASVSAKAGPSGVAWIWSHSRFQEGEEGNCRTDQRRECGEQNVCYVVSSSPEESMRAPSNDPPPGQGENYACDTMKSPPCSCQTGNRTETGVQLNGNLFGYTCLCTVQRPSMYGQK
ncbi:hypothetical protein PtrSN002B_010634 [Pyrenophora tritici-repentis]|uniref:Uncharacterized protein n=2 Tax=Pyrenophora tritici-repentis TaxID=45151 RepID=A0A2W1DBS3_9PLEO|nr:uncharacterized protein PTRG_03424 [Pyrenophora tritici-repentis Pt-1C-BFP]KAA8620552.1 hypothetical protein PtrV1_07646 [Pyrenophora tritici-repentis]EDU46262.1 predicted protein [Pyrenophora tritici-repentis Pt-1C-BFP]KAF7448701.1 hypothetical protein A1F99_080650 [Pyrenophora tritici-repentis]KAF7572423.1 hypothetical protein PtrM4_099230 [Pyrenophora tritici-repentis]KAG9384397.1 hypothetical protein A1F94_003944 [Pyrenophora tritici-repentis]